MANARLLQRCNRATHTQYGQYARHDCLKSEKGRTGAYIYIASKMRLPQRGYTPAYVNTLGLLLRVVALPQYGEPVVASACGRARASAVACASLVSMQVAMERVA